MESLSQILSGETAPDVQASTSEGNAEQTTDVKTTDVGKTAAAASATSAEQAKEGDVKAEGESKDKPKGDAKPDAQSRDENGRFDKPESKDKTGKPEEVIAGLQAALTASRKKTQELERKAKEQPKDDEPKKDFWEDPEAHIGERISAETEKVRHDLEVKHYNRCERDAKRNHSDYEDVVNSLMQETEADPILAQQVFSQARESDDPAEFFYSYATQRKEMKAVGGDLGKYKTSIEAPHLERIGKLEEENKALQAKLEKLGKIPSSLNAQPSATRAAIESEAVEDESLEEITKPRKRRA